MENLKFSELQERLEIIFSAYNTGEKERKYDEIINIINSLFSLFPFI